MTPRWHARALLDRHRRPAILLHRSYPPTAAPPDAVSRLGGMPCLPDEVEWPRGAASGTPLHFLAQVDCAELPPTGFLPEVGLLLFFAKVDEEMLWEDHEAAESCRVVYDPSPHRGAVRAAPPDLPPREGGWSQELRVFGSAQGEAGPVLYPSWPLLAAPIDSWPGYFDLPEVERAGLEFEVYGPAHAAAQAGTILAATGRPPAIERRPSWGDQSRVVDGRRVPHLVMPAQAEPPFPQAWVMIERIARALVRGCERELESDPAAASAADFAAAVVAARAFIVEADALGPAGAPRPDQARDFAAWLSGLLAGSFPLREIAVRALEDGMRAAVTFAACSPETAALIPAAYYAELESEHAPSTVHSSRASTGFAHRYALHYHQMLGHAQVSQASGEAGSAPVALLELVSDAGVGFMFCDCGEATFWIAPDDLAARRFERAYATTTGG